MPECFNELYKGKNALMDSMNLTLAVFLVLIGFVLFGLELFLPTGGILGMLALSSMIVGITFAFKQGLLQGAIFLALSGVGVPVALRLFFWAWPRTSMGRKMTVRSVAAEQTIGNMASHQALDLLVGKIGKTLSELRPSGIVEFEGRRIDAISEGLLVAEGLPVVCISAQGGHVVVKPFVVTGFENEQISNMDLN